MNRSNASEPQDLYGVLSTDARAAPSNINRRCVGLFSATTNGLTMRVLLILALFVAGASAFGMWSICVDEEILRKRRRPWGDLFAEDCTLSPLADG
jgi:hypothetical protein